jgi:MraZ protein
LLFVGTYEHTIDNKQRLAIPSEIRDQLPEGSFLYATLIEGPTLAIYTEAGFEKRAEELDHSERSPEEVLMYEEEFFSNSARLEIDKQGRIRLPERLLGETGLDKDVVIIGVKDHMRVKDRAAWNAEKARRRAERPDLLANPRLVMKKAPAPAPGNQTPGA